MPAVATQTTTELVAQVCGRFGHDRTRLMDMLWALQKELRGIDKATQALLAQELGTRRVVIEGMVSFYAFFTDQPTGRLAIRLCDDVIDRHAGMEEISRTLQQELGLGLEQTSADGLFSLHHTPCIGLSDQAPALLVNEVPVTRLTPERTRALIHLLRQNPDPAGLAQTLVGDFAPLGDDCNAHLLIHSLVENQIRLPGPVLFAEHRPFSGLQAALQQTPAQLIAELSRSGLRGRGGAGFPTGRKWDFTHRPPAERRYLICNADEGEPGTFKDRVLLTEKPDLLIEGMVIAARAIGCAEGIIYLRAEYEYLLAWLENRLLAARAAGWLGQAIGGVQGFDFDIRIQMGAGAYVCGEESALISSCEGLRGEPKNRPPFPAERGYLGCPTCVDNVETLACAARIFAEGADWFRALGTEQSSGSKLLSISGDCARPGVYEVEFGIRIAELLALVGAEQTGAVLVGGPSGQFIGADQFERRIGFEDLPTGGALLIFNQSRNLLEVVNHYLDFFIDESCGYCTPCRVGTVFMKKRMEKLVKGSAEPSDLDYLKNLGATLRASSRCGLGLTAPNPVLSTLEHFPMIYSALVKPPKDGQHAYFDIQAALEESRHLAKRRSMIYDVDYEH
jgi:[NiFe] hydrogenase diaphorase moiety large subunit